MKTGISGVNKTKQKLSCRQLRRADCNHTPNGIVKLSYIYRFGGLSIVHRRECQIIVQIR